MKNLITIFSVVLLVGCNQPSLSKNDRTVSGPVNQHFVEQLQILKANQSVRISSIGGWHSSALKSAYLIKNLNLSITINELCLSACAAYIMPSANTLVFENNPIIGYHKNPILTANIIRKHAVKNLNFCHFIAERELLNLYNSTPIKKGFWLSEQKFLNLLDPKIEYQKYKCPETNPIYENWFWLPTSPQLHNIIGLKFKGTVCADDYTACVKKIDRRWKAGTRIVVGDEVYVSKGIN